jgi:hypothetical protein
MSIPTTLLTTTCDIYRPFGAGSPTHTAVPCRLVPDLPRGRGSGLAGVLAWSHYIDLQDTADILDGCSRPAGSDSELFNDGDEVRIPSGASTRYVVVWVETRLLGTANAYKRAYLLRNAA